MWSGKPHRSAGKNDHLPEWARRDSKVAKGDRVEDLN